MAVVDAESPLVRAFHYTDVIGDFAFDGVVDAGLHVRTADREPIRINAIDDARAHSEVHVSFEGHPHVLHTDIIEVDNHRIDAWI